MNSFKKLLLSFLVVLFVGCATVKQEYLNEGIYSGEHVNNLRIEYCGAALFAHDIFYQELNGLKSCNKKEASVFAKSLSTITPSMFDDCGYTLAMDMLLSSGYPMNDAMIKAINKYDAKIISTERIYNTLKGVHIKQCTNTATASYKE